MGEDDAHVSITFAIDTSNSDGLVERLIDTAGVFGRVSFDSRCGIEVAGGDGVPVTYLRLTSDAAPLAGDAAALFPGLAAPAVLWTSSALPDSDPRCALPPRPSAPRRRAAIGMTLIAAAAPPTPEEATGTSSKRHSRAPSSFRPSLSHLTAPPPHLLLPHPRTFLRIDDFSMFSGRASEYYANNPNAAPPPSTAAGSEDSRGRKLINLFSASVGSGSGARCVFLLMPPGVVAAARPDASSSLLVAPPPPPPGTPPTHSDPRQSIIRIQPAAQQRRAGLHSHLRHLRGLGRALPHGRDGQLHRNHGQRAGHHHSAD